MLTACVFIIKTLGNNLKLFDSCSSNLFISSQLTDLTLARENQPKFQKYLDDNVHVHPGIELNVTVLTTGFWPSYKSFDLNLPAEMVSFMCFPLFPQKILEIEEYDINLKHLEVVL